jgi:polar amino acid transport system permease protein
MIGIWDDFIDNWQVLLKGLLVSIEMAVLALFFGLILGLVLAIGTMSGRALVRSIAIVLVEAGRGAPALVVLQIIYFGLPNVGMTFTGFVTAVIALTLTTGAYTAEIMRGGLQAVPQGEVEAGEALGMSRASILRDVVVPQGLRIAIPPLMGFAIIIFQATSLTLYVGGERELLRTANSLASQTFNYFNFFLIAAVLYAVITIPASSLTERVERRMGRHLQ